MSVHVQVEPFGIGGYITSKGPCVWSDWKEEDEVDLEVIIEWIAS